MWDAPRLELHRGHRDSYRRIHRRSLVTLRRFPALVKPASINDIVQHQQLLGDVALRARLADKASMKSFVRELLGADAVAKTYALADHLGDVDFGALPSAFVVKATHDAGSTLIVRDKANVDWTELVTHFDHLLATPYGRTSAEIHYERIPPRVLVEELLVTSDCSPPPDVKCHCAYAEVILAATLTGRHGDPSSRTECCRSRDGTLLPLRAHLAFGPCPPNAETVPPFWRNLIEAAERLSRDLPYVRVDAYPLGSRIVIGELTFTPRAGGRHASADGFIAERIVQRWQDRTRRPEVRRRR